MHSWYMLGIGIAVFAISCAFPHLAELTSNKLVKAYLAIMDGVLTIASVFLCAVGIGHGLWGFVIVFFAQLSLGTLFHNVMGDDYKPYGIEPRTHKHKKERGSHQLDQRLIDLNATIQARLDQTPLDFDDLGLAKLLRDLDSIVKEWS